MHFVVLVVVALYASALALPLKQLDLDRQVKKHGDGVDPTETDIQEQPLLLFS